MKADAYVAGDPRSAADVAIRAQKVGYDGVFIPEMRHDPFLVAGSVATAVPEMTVGTAVAIAFARSPMTVAYSAWDLARMTGGRFILGLGTQVRPHVVHRFSMPWSAPIDRLRDFVAALRAIWSSWQEGSPLRHRGPSYRFSLMTPAFDPGPIDHPDIPIALSGVGPGLTRLAGEVADGFHLHPFHTIAYLDDVIAPELEAGTAGAGRAREAVERICAVMVATGRTAAEVDDARAAARRQIAFYASTPTYRAVLEHSEYDIGDELTRLSRRGDWEAMASLVPDELVDEVATVAPIDELGGRLRERYRGRLDRIGIFAPGPLEMDVTEERELLDSLRR